MKHLVFYIKVVVKNIPNYIYTKGRNVCIKIKKILKKIIYNNNI